MGVLRVVVADVQRLSAEAFAGALAMQTDFEVLDAQARTGLEAVETFVRLAPDVMVLDYWLGEMNGAAATRQIREAHPAARVVVLGWLYGPLQVHEAHAAGVAAFVPKSVGLDELLAVIRGVSAGYSVFPGPNRTSSLQWSQPPPASPAAPVLRLTPREIEVLQLFCEGNRRNEVAVALGIREGTVKNHVHHILTKTGARTVLEAVARAREDGLVRHDGRRRRS